MVTMPIVSMFGEHCGFKQLMIVIVHRHCQVNCLVVNCHQCRRSDRTVVSCTKCKEKFYCIKCIREWYPKLEEEEVSELCPYCRGKCNCNLCLQSSGMLKTLFLEVLCLLISWLWSSNNCSTLIVHLHRSCPDYSYEQCLSCCQELRRGMFPGNSCRAVYKYSDRGCDYMHGREPLPESFHNMKIPQDQNKPISWVANCDGYIICAPVEMGGCEKCVLELKHLLTRNWISTLNAKAERILIQCNFSQMISQPICRTDDPELLHKAASRVGSDDNCLYSTTAKDATEDEALLHFRRRWAKGKPVIVRNVLEHTSGLSWEPMVMWRKKKQKFTVLIMAYKHGCHFAATNYVTSHFHLWQFV